MPSMEFTEDAEQQLTSTIIAYGLTRWHCGKNKKVDAAIDYLSLKDFPLIASTLSRLLDTKEPPWWPVRYKWCFQVSLSTAN